MDAPRRLLSLIEAEQLTGRKVATWRKDIRQRRIAHVRIGRQVRIPLEVIEGLIAAGYRPAITQPLADLDGGIQKYKVRLHEAG